MLQREALALYLELAVQCNRHKENFAVSMALCIQSNNILENQLIDGSCEVHWHTNDLGKIALNRLPLRMQPSNSWMSRRTKICGL